MTYISWSDGNSFMIHIHSWYDHAHFTRSFKPQDICFLKMFRKDFIMFFIFKVNFFSRERHGGSPGNLFVSQLKKHLETPTFTGTAKHSSFVLEAPTTGKMEIERFPKTLLTLAASNLNILKKKKIPLLKKDMN